MKNTTQITVQDNMSKVFEDVSPIVTGLQFEGGSRIDYADRKMRRGVTKFEVNRWTNKDSNAFDGYGVYIGFDNAFASVGKAMSIGENRMTKGGSYESNKQSYIWIRTQDEYDTLLSMLKAVATGEGVTFEAQATTGEDKAQASRGKASKGKSQASRGKSKAKDKTTDKAVKGA